jgi:hypothetical protein
VDVAQLLAGLAITSLREVSLTGSHPAAAHTWPNRDFAAGAPMFTVEPALAEAVAADGNMSIPAPDGFDRQGQWVGVVKTGAEPTYLPSQPLEDWSADRGAGGWFSGPRLVVTLQPSEIRTFELTLQQSGAAAAEQ